MNRYKYIGKMPPELIGMNIRGYTGKYIYYVVNDKEIELRLAGEDTEAHIQDIPICLIDLYPYDKPIGKL